MAVDPAASAGGTGVGHAGGEGAGPDPEQADALGAGGLALTVHSSYGVVDLVVPAQTRVTELAAAYAAACRLPRTPSLRTPGGGSLSGEASLAACGLDSGAILTADLADLAASSPPPGRDFTPGGQVAPADRHDRRLGGVALGVAAGLAVLAGWCGTQVSGTRQDLVVVLLAIGALTGLLPFGGYAGPRAVVAPAFAGSAALTAAWSPEPERLATIIGGAALVAAVLAAAVRAVGRAEDGVMEALGVWIVTGAVVFVVTFGAALLDAPRQVPWAVLLVAAALAARLVPGSAVEVPDSALIEVDRLAVTAWSAREPGPGRRGRTVVPVEEVSAIAARGTRLLAAASVAVLVLTLVCAPLLLATATVAVDRVGARVMVLAGGVALLLAARAYRYWLPRLLLRLAGVYAAVVGLVAALAPASTGVVAALGGAAVVSGLVVVSVAVATGRGWRSVWWAARADLVEVLAGATVLGVLPVAIGVVRRLWER
ncbi:MAG: hypothetical protein QM638_14625 [Nocardioides sp.]|uniref:hypothetical protein n=1 Tax=Nocardioides sp. TaxID=35761 RepID=UPI0039E5DFBE